MKNIKRILETLLVIVMFIMSVPMSALIAFADSIDTNVTTEFAGGSGTEADPYLIETKYHLDNVRNDLDAYYKMISDIEFTDADFAKDGDFYNDGEGWEPIGAYDTPFSGVFDGNGHKILGLQMPIILSKINIDRHYGFIGCNTGTIKNLILNICIQSNTAKEDYTTNIGGITGHNSGEILNCGISGSVEVDIEFLMTYCTTASLSVGGIAGENFGTISDSYNLMNIEATQTEKSYFPKLAVGGIVGRNSDGVVRRCYNAGRIIANLICDRYDVGRDFAGGIVGFNNDQVYSCYNVGDVSAVSSSGYNYYGGIAGNNSGSISTSYSVANSIENIASSNSGNIENCYFHSETLFAGCKLASLFSELTYQGFDFESVWQMSDGDYPLPVLRSVKNYANFEYSPEENTVDFAGGKGIKSRPFVVTTAEHLNNIRKYPTSYYIIENDIIITNEDYESGGLFPNRWIPFAFKGSLDGNGYSIKNLRMELSSPGLFATNNGVIKNLTIDSSVISVTNVSGNYGGFIVAENKGSIINCHSKDSTIALGTGYHYFGGIAGNNVGTIQNCTSDNNINWGSTGGRVGGIASNNSGTIDECINRSAIVNTGYTPISGGIAAQNSGTISASRNLATISAKSTSSSISARVGGIVGEMTDGEIRKCYNTGNVNAEATEYKGNAYAGGIVAYISGGKITNSYNTADVYGKSSSSYASTYVGGLIGYNNSIKSTQNCYSVGGNSGRASSSNLYVGYICGYNATSTIENCYYLGVSGNGSGSGDMSKIYGKTVSVLKSQDTYSGFDFDNIWTMSGNDDYPFPELNSSEMEYEKVAKSIAVESLPKKLEYITNYEEFDVTGGTIKITYKYDMHDIVSFSEAQVSGFNNEVLGDQKITVSYLGFTTSFDVEIVEKSLEKIEVTKLPNKTIYYEDDPFASQGMIVTAYYNDGSYENIDNYSVSGYLPTLGTKTVTVSFNGKTDSFEVTVINKELMYITVTKKPNKLTYLEGDFFDITGMVITAYYNNSTRGVITDYTISGYSSSFGAKTITISYGEETTTFTVEVLPTNRWVQEGGAWYYYKADGTIAKGWLQLGNTWYYLNSDGEMQTGWLKLGDTWYYLTSSGAMATGWLQDGGSWYYLSPGGAMQTGWLKSGSTWYYLQSSGAMATDWAKVNGTYYYFNGSGAMQTGWLKSGSTWYYLQSSGAMATGWAKVNGTYYYFNQSGAMQTGWLKLGNTWYYLKDSGAMATGSLKIGNKWYNFNSSGAWIA